MKIYIKYVRPFEGPHDEPLIDEVWSGGTKPKKELADGATLYVYNYDSISKSTNNGRIWDGKE